ncbi:MAG TPA: TRAFs-binding domain-containing protein [Candidatus Udaeobacter sp.]|nr:TRAFs-binding domain-containing protein [Candidatus Udaeobacter sp.]
MQQAEEALDKDDFVMAKALFAHLHRAMPNEPHIAHRLALATYKAKLPTEIQALEQACDLLAGLDPVTSTDPETLGLLQAVHKRLWSLTQDRAHLEKAIWSSEKGFLLKNDYYNGINLAFLYNVRASISSGAEAIADFVMAQRTRRRVIDICEALLADAQTQNGAKRLDSDATYWVLATLAEAWAGLGDEEKSQEYMTHALALQPPPPSWMIKSTQDQLNRLRALLSDSPLKNGSAAAAGAQVG